MGFATPPWLRRAKFRLQFSGRNGTLVVGYVSRINGIPLVPGINECRRRKILCVKSINRKGNCWSVTVTFSLRMVTPFGYTPSSLKGPANVQIFEGVVIKRHGAGISATTRYVRSVTGLVLNGPSTSLTFWWKRSKLYATVVYAVLSSTTSVNGLVRVPALLNVVATSKL